VLIQMSLLFSSQWNHFMPTLTRWFVNTSFIYLALALIAGLLVEIQSTFKVTAKGGLFPVYLHLLVFG